VLNKALIEEEEEASHRMLRLVVYLTLRYMWYQNFITLFDCMLEESFDFLSHLASQRNMFHLTTFEYRFDVTLGCRCCYSLLLLLLPFAYSNSRECETG
jgi:hypothetical protein